MPSRSLPARFLAKISPEPTSGCWLWTGAVDRAGYGQVHLRRRTVSAHRAVFELLCGRSEELDHTCRVRSCVNPAHLQPVSHRENMRRGTGFAGKNARKTHCDRGHAFTPDNTRAHGDGNRACKECERVRRQSPLSAMRHEAATLPYPDALRRNALGMRHPASVPLPQELRRTVAVLDSARGGAVGSRRAARSSSYVSPLRARAERSGTIYQLRAVLIAARTHVVADGTLLESVADGTAAGWQARLALQHALSYGENLADWDNAAGRTRAERLALVERVLGELGDEPARRGGWSVSR